MNKDKVIFLKCFKPKTISDIPVDPRQNYLQSAKTIIQLATKRAVISGRYFKGPFDPAQIQATITAEINSLALIYGFHKTEELETAIHTLVKTATASSLMDCNLKHLREAQMNHLAPADLNAMIAGSITATAGQIACLIFEEVVSDKNSLQDIKWVTAFVLYRFGSPFFRTVLKSFLLFKNNEDTEVVAQKCMDLFPLGYENRYKNSFV